jgi:hypothetical protein
LRFFDPYVIDALERLDRLCGLIAQAGKEEFRPVRAPNDVLLNFVERPEPKGLDLVA